MHDSGCFVLPNPWDIGTTIYLERLGFKALATTSAGFAFSRGKHDGGVPRDQMLAHIREIVEATALPVNADFLNGFAHNPEEVAANVKLCVDMGVAGLSVEDNSQYPAAPLYEKHLAVERIRAARAAIESSETGVVLTGRCEAWLVHDPTPLRTALERLAAYAEAGADCLYAPGVRDPKTIAAIVKAVAPRPVNVLVGSPGLTVPQLAGLGVRRISVGGALARAAWAGFIRAAREILEQGTFGGFSGATPFAELESLFSAHSA